jgi:hypothetical protein
VEAVCSDKSHHARTLQMSTHETTPPALESSCEFPVTVLPCCGPVEDGQSSKLPLLQPGRAICAPTCRLSLDQSHLADVSRDGRWPRESPSNLKAKGFPCSVITPHEPGCTFSTKHLLQCGEVSRTRASGTSRLDALSMSGNYHEHALARALILECLESFQRPCGFSGIVDAT